eukprot:6211131-Pleurochrysis_carterae.AAC.1
MSGAARRQRGARPTPYERPAPQRHPPQQRGVLGSLLGYASAPLRWGVSLFSTGEQEEEEDVQATPEISAGGILSPNCIASPAVSPAEAND